MKTPKLILAALALVGAVALVRTGSLQATQPVAVADGAAPHVKWTTAVLGFGLDQKSAVDNALKKATTEVHDYLRKQNPPFEWKPSPEYVKRHLLKKGEPERLPKNDYTVQDKGKDQNWECWGLTVEVTPVDFEAMRRVNESVLLAGKQADRLWVLAKLTGLVLAALMLTLGYLAVEDRTKGYCSRWLLFGAVTVLLLVGAGLFILG